MALSQIILIIDNLGFLALSEAGRRQFLKSDLKLQFSFVSMLWNTHTKPSNDFCSVFKTVKKRMIGKRHTTQHIMV